MKTILSFLWLTAALAFAQVPLCPTGVTLNAENAGYPASATQLTAVPQGSGALLNWVDNSSDETGFLIERKEGAGAYATVTILGPGMEAYADLFLSPATDYTYRVSTLNGFGSASPSNEAQVTTNAFVNPPTNITVVLTPLVGGETTARATIRWQDNSDNETNFVVERRTGVGVFVVIATLAADVEEFVDTGLLLDESYSYRVKAIDTLN